MIDPATKRELDELVSSDALLELLNQPTAPMIMYPVNDIYVSVQGEGAKTGTPMLIVRLQGCTVGCHFCDTKETWEIDMLKQGRVGFLGKNKFFSMFAPLDLAAYCRQFVDTNTLWSLASREQWVLLTGGEPSMYMLAELVDALHNKDFKVALETSGVYAGHYQAAIDWVTVSPKINNPANKPLEPKVLESADELKFVIGGERHVQEMFALLDTITPKAGAIISVQPMSQSKKATKLCVELAQQRGFNLSLQTHKYINIP